MIELRILKSAKVKMEDACKRSVSVLILAIKWKYGTDYTTIDNYNGKIGNGEGT